MVGGTGMYIRAFCEGLDPIPAIPGSIRQKYISLFEEGGLPALQALIQHADKEFSSSGETANPRRLMRALEVKEHTGRSILSYHTKPEADRPFNILKFYLDLPRPELYERINRRVDKMMEDGLLDEVRSLLPFKTLNALQTVGYTELFGHLEGKTSLGKAVDLVKQHTRNYAKRQVTWFKNQDEFQAIHPDKLNDISLPE